MKNKKTYVLMVSQFFLKGHPRAGELTGFPANIVDGIKETTIRGKYAFWERRLKAVQAGDAILSVRTWLGKPYNSPQVKLRDFETIDFEPIRIEVAKREFNIYLSEKMISPREEVELVRKETLSLTDFRHWFKAGLAEGILIKF